MTFRLCCLSACFVLHASALVAQSPLPGSEPPTAPVVVLSTALYNDQANLRESSDSTKAGLGSQILRGRIGDSLGSQLLRVAMTDSLELTPGMRSLTGGIPCNVKVACALAVAKQQGARWVVMSKVGKTSNLIWLLSAQLIRVRDGMIILDDSTELKGEPDLMVSIGMRQFADRVTRTIRAGGVATNYPNGEPHL